MFAPLVIFVAILILPIIVAFILHRLAHIDTSGPSALSASYWGKYEGQPDAPSTGTIPLLDCTEDENSNSVMPSRAVAWHP
jgi:hypothetical protein